MASRVAAWAEGRAAVRVNGLGLQRAQQAYYEQVIQTVNNRQLHLYDSVQQIPDFPGLQCTTNQRARSILADGKFQEALTDEVLEEV